MAFPLAGVGTPAAATLTVPIDTSSQDGSISPDTSHVIACLVFGPITPAAGSVDIPPTADCSVSVPMVYAATPQPMLTADLGPLLNTLSLATGVALLPDETQGTPTDVWQVTFSAHDRAASATDAVTPPSAAASITFTPGEPSVRPVVPVASDPAVAETPAGQGDDTTTASGQGFAPPPPAALNAPAAPAGVAAQTPPAAGPPRASTSLRGLTGTRTVEVGYAYPAIWLLPLVFLFAIPMVSRSLTREPKLPPRSTG